MYVRVHAPVHAHAELGPSIVRVYTELGARLAVSKPQ